MSTLRRAFKVSWDDGPLVEVTSNAWDMAAAQEYASDETKAVFALVHHALKRNGHDVKSLTWWVDHLDEMEPVTEDGEELEPLPTLLEGSGNGVLPLRSSQEQIPDSGLTTTDSSSQQNVS